MSVSEYCYKFRLEYQVKYGREPEKIYLTDKQLNLLYEEMKERLLYGPDIQNVKGGLATIYGMKIGKLEVIK